MSSFFVKILPEVRGWRFLQKPAGLELYSPVRRLIFALLFWFLSAGFLIVFFSFSSLIPSVTVNLWYWCGGKESGKKRLRLKRKGTGCK